MRGRDETWDLQMRVGKLRSAKSEIEIQNAVGLTGLEPVTLRLSSACSNQLSYRPCTLRVNLKFQIRNFKFPIGGAEESRTPDL